MANDDKTLVHFDLAAFAYFDLFHLANMSHQLEEEVGYALPMHPLTQM